VAALPSTVSRVRPPSKLIKPRPHLSYGSGALQQATGVAQEKRMSAVPSRATIVLDHSPPTVLTPCPIQSRLELGSKNPYVVGEDADLKEASRQAAEGAFFYSGQRWTVGSAREGNTERVEIVTRVSPSSAASGTH